MDFGQILGQKTKKQQIPQNPWILLKIGPLVLGSFGKYMKSGGFHV